MITYETGNPHFGGQTVVRLSSNGELFIEQNRGVLNRTFKEKVDPALHREIVILLKQACRSASDLPESTPVPGETMVRLHAAVALETIDLRFWSNQRWRDPILNRLISQFERLAVEASRGIVRF